MNYVFKPLPMLASILFMVLISTAVIVRAQDAEPAKPRALQGVMEKLGRDMQNVTGAISKEDWALVAQLAPKIARHAEPPLSEKMRILTWLGTDAGKFRDFDEQTKKAASAMGGAATRGDGQAVIAAFAKVQQSCLDCHRSFREPFVKHFDEKR